MRTIIAPTDFSQVSLNALNYAANLAAEIRAELILLNVVQMPMTVAEIPLTEFEYDEMKEEAEHELSSVVHKLRRNTKNKIKIHAKMMVGSVGHELEEICMLKQPFAVVMGSKGAGAVERFLIGSNTIFAVNNLKYPVLVVPQNVSFKSIRKIALASDLKEMTSYKALDFLKQWVQTFKCKLDIINIVEDHEVKPDAVPASISLENLLSEFHPKFYFIQKQNVQEGVYEYAEENHPDVLMIIPKQHGLFGGLLHKSKSKPFILHPHIPVLAIAE